MNLVDSHIAANSWSRTLELFRHELSQEDILSKVYRNSPQYPQGSVEYSLNQYVETCSVENLTEWLGGRKSDVEENVTVLNPSNIPLVGLRDLLAVTLLGKNYTGVLSRGCSILLPKIVSIFENIHPGNLQINFSSFDEAINTAQRVIATGSDRTIASVKGKCLSSAIEESKCLFRGHKIGVAITGNRLSEQGLAALAEDVLMYDGRGCRSIAILFASQEFDLELLASSFREFRKIIPPSNSCRESLCVPSAFEIALSTINGGKVLTGDGFLITEGTAKEQGLGHLKVVRYEDLNEVENWLSLNEVKVQHLASNLELSLSNSIAPQPFGHSQIPSISWDPNGVDIIDWLTS